MKKVISVLLSAALTLFLSTCTFAVAAEEDVPDYLRLMTDAVISGDIGSGRLAETRRNAWIDENNSDESKVSFDELYVLSKYIYARAGSIRLSDELRMCVGEVALNRVASPEFPNNLLDVILDDGDVPSALSVGQTGGRPNRPSVEAALRLLLGERMMEPSVIYQSKERIGEVYASFADKLLGFTYFCKSEHSQLYAVEETLPDTDF